MAGRERESRDLPDREVPARDNQTQDQVYWENYFNNRVKLKTHIPYERLPKGYEYMWARYLVSHMQDANNLSVLFSDGWTYLLESEAPGLFSHGNGLEEKDSDPKVRCNEMVMVKRPSWIGEIEANNNRQKRKKSANIYSVINSSSDFAGVGSVSVEKTLEQSNAGLQGKMYREETKEVSSKYEID